MFAHVTFFFSLGSWYKRSHVFKEPSTRVWFIHCFFLSGSCPYHAVSVFATSNLIALVMARHDFLDMEIFTSPALRGVKRRRPPAAPFRRHLALPKVLAREKRKTNDKRYASECVRHTQLQALRGDKKKRKGYGTCSERNPEKAIASICCHRDRTCFYRMANLINGELVQILDGSGLFDRGYNFEKGVCNENGESALKKSVLFTP